MTIPITDFFRLRQDLPVVDVRSESEFEAGRIPGAINIPLLNNKERVIVGTAYKQRGQQEAISEGFRLVGPRLEAIMLEAGKAAPGGAMLAYCWRGGMRSGNFCQFVNMAGLHAQALAGGYKTYRQAAHQSFAMPLTLTLLTGCTGSGKSEVLRALADRGEQILDLEKLAHHKGSAFGGLLMPAQPTTEQFQNDLFEKIRKLDPGKRVWVEDESLAIGRIFLPPELWSTMNRAPLIQMDVAKAIRIQRLVGEYGHSDPDVFLTTMKKIAKRLGGQHFKSACATLLQGDMASTIDILLTYYDKAYLEGIASRRERVRCVIPWNGENVEDYVTTILATYNPGGQVNSGNLWLG